MEHVSHVTCDLCEDPVKKPRNICAAFFCLDGKIDVCPDCFKTNRGDCEWAQRLENGIVVEEKVCRLRCRLDRHPGICKVTKQGDKSDDGHRVPTTGPRDGNHWTSTEDESLRLAIEHRVKQGAILSSKADFLQGRIRLVPNRNAKAANRRYQLWARAID